MVRGNFRSPNDYTQREYLGYLKNWEENFPSTDSKKKIVIIGAGMSGLICGWLLSRVGHSVKIFEASNVVGGRVKTLRERFTGGLYAEAGAMRIPKTHKLTSWLVENVLPEPRFWEFTKDCDNAHFFLNNVRKTVKVMRGDIEAAEGNVVEAIKTLLERDHQITIETPLLQLNSESSEFYRIREKLDHYSFAAFLTDKLWHSIAPDKLDYPNYIASVLNLEALLPVSMAAIFDALYIFAQQDFYQIPNGMDRLPKAFVDDDIGDRTVKPKLSTSLRYNRRVTEIIEEPNRVFVRYENPATSYGNNYEKDIDEKWFDLAVIAIPFSALRRVLMTHTQIHSGKAKSDQTATLSKLVQSNTRILRQSVSRHTLVPGKGR